MDDEQAEPSAEGIGRRVRATRKLAGLTQQQLAHRAHVSLGLVRSVEQERIPASPSFIAAAARALDVSATELMAQPAEVSTRADYRLHAVIAPLRRELATYALPPSDDRPVPDLDALAAAVARASAMRQAADLAALGAELPPVLAGLRAATYTLDSAARERAFGLLAEAYAAAGNLIYKLGYADLSSLTTDRVQWAAAQSGDELAVAAADFYRAGEIINTADWTGAARYLDGARERIEHRRDSEAGLSMWGQLHLKSGLAAARAGDGEAADDHLAEAQDAVRHVRDGADHYRLAFDRSSVDIWSVSLAVEAMDGTRALTRAADMSPPDTAPPERVGHHYIDTARAFLLHGDRERTFGALMSARRISPQQTRHHPQVHETVRVLAEQDRRRTDSLAGFARWAGIAV